MAILELRAARGWSRQQTAEAFLVTAATITSWTKRLDEEGPDALLQLRSIRIKDLSGHNTKGVGTRMRGKL